MRRLICTFAFLFFCVTHAHAQSQTDQTTYVFPQIADGDIGNGLRYSAELTVRNNSDTPVNVTVDFLGDNGQPVAFALGLASAGAGAETASRFQFSVPGRGLRVLRGGSGAYPARAAWARVTSEVRARPSLTYRLESTAAPGPPLTEVTVLDARSSAGQKMAVPVVQDLGRARLGVAIANNLDRVLNGQATVYNENGISVGTFSVQVPANGQVVKFLNELVQLPANFRGLLQIDWSTAGNGIMMGLAQYPDGVLAAVPVLRANRSTTKSSPELPDSPPLVTFCGSTMFAHFAAGRTPAFDYLGQIVLANGESRTSSPRLRIFDNSGSPIAFGMATAGETAQQSASIFNLSVPPKGIRVLRSVDNGSEARSGWICFSGDASTMQVDFVAVPPSQANLSEQRPITQVSVGGREQYTLFTPCNGCVHILPVVQDTGGRTGFSVVNSLDQQISGVGTIRDEAGAVTGSFSFVLPPQGRLIDFVDQKFSLPPRFRGTLTFTWPGTRAPDYLEAGYVLGLVQYANGVLAGLPLN